MIRILFTLLLRSLGRLFSIIQFPTVASLVIIFGVGCSHDPVLKSEKTRELLFPHGTYQHIVQVEVLPVPLKGPKNFDFRGVFLFQKDQIKLIGLSPIGTTLFRVEENVLTQDLKIETYMDVLKKAEGQIKEQYLLMKEILTMKIKNLKSNNVVLKNKNDFPMQMNFQNTKGSVDIFLKDYDKNSIPRFLEITTKAYKIQVKVESYEF